MAAFVDTSALVKVYADEAGQDRVRTLQQPFVIATITRVEVIAAFWFKQRTQALTAQAAQGLTERFEADLRRGHCWTGQALVPVDVDWTVLDAAARACAVHGLRGYDAVQLAAAQVARAADSGCAEFITFDQALARAAATERFVVTP